MNSGRFGSRRNQIILTNVCGAWRHYMWVCFVICECGCAAPPHQRPDHSFLHQTRYIHAPPPLVFNILKKSQYCFCKPLFLCTLWVARSMKALYARVAGPCNAWSPDMKFVKLFTPKIFTWKCVNRHFQHFTTKVHKSTFSTWSQVLRQCIDIIKIMWFDCFLWCFDI